MMPATRHETSKPMPEQHITLTTDFHCTAEEMQRIRQGFTPQQMEDKWHMFVEDNTIYIHRSWTGFCIYTAHFIPDDDGYHVEQFQVNRDPDQYRTSGDDYDIRKLDMMVKDLAGIVSSG